MRPDDFSWLQVLFKEMNALKPYLASSFVRKTTFPCSRSFEVAKQFRGKAAFPERGALYYRHAF